MRVVVVAGRRITQPRKAGQALAFGEHVGSDAGLPGGQRVSEQVRLKARDPGPVFHVAVILRRVHAVVLGRQACNGLFEVPDRSQMLVQASLVLLSERLAELERVLAHGIQNTLLPLDPTRVSLAEKALEELVREHLRRERPLVGGPAHIALDALSEGFLRNADLQGPEARVAADFRGDRLVDRRRSRAPARKGGSRHQRAHGTMMPVSRSRNLSGRVVQAGDHVNVAAQGSQRRQAGSQ